ncbi:MAG: GatB/YqeY domain-containing protein [Actinomycetota bacterium]
MSTGTTLKSRIQNDITGAVRSGDELSKSTLRMALAAIMNAEVAGKEAVVLSDEQVVAVLRSEVKKRLESAQIYQDAGRTELAERERGEVAILERYLPAAMDAAALAAIVSDEVANAAGAGQTGPKAMGAVIKAVRDRVGDGADGSTIAAAVKAALG